MKTHTTLMLLIAATCSLCVAQELEPPLTLPKKGGIVVTLEPKVDTLRFANHLKTIREKPGTEQAAQAQLSIALVYYDANAFNGSARELRKVVDLYSSFGVVEDAQYYLAQSYSKLQADSLAIDVCRNLLKQFPKSKWADESLNLVGLSFYRMGRYEDAIREYQQALTSAPSFKYRAEAWMTIGQSQRVLKKYDEAAAAFDNAGKSAQGVEGRSEAQLQIALTLKVAKQFDRAIVELKKVIDSYPSVQLKARAQYEIASIHLQRNNADNAAVEYEKVVDLYPTEPAAPYASFHIGMILLQKKQFDKAIERFKKTESTFTDFPQKDWLLFFIGKCYSDTGRREQAKPYIQKLLSDYPESSLRSAALKMLNG